MYLFIYLYSVFMYINRCLFLIFQNKTLYLGKNKSFNNIPSALNHHPFSIEIFHENSEDEETEMNSNALDYNPESFNDKQNEGFDHDNNHEGINNEGFDSELDHEKIDNEENEDLNRGIFYGIHHSL